MAKAIALNAIHQNYTVFYREAHELLFQIHEARQLKQFGKFKEQMKASDLVVIDDLFL